MAKSNFGLSRRTAMGMLGETALAAGLGTQVGIPPCAERGEVAR